MTSVQQHLYQVMIAYRQLPLDNLVSDTLVLTSQEADPILGAASASFGFSRAKFYIDNARSLMNQILSEAEEIDWNMSVYGDLLAGLPRKRRQATMTSAIIEMAVKYRSGANLLSVHSELLWHYYALSLQHAWHFLENCVKIVDEDYERDSCDNSYVELIRAFRNHMEHRDKATLNLSSADWKSMSRRDQHNVIVGYKRDHKNNILFMPTGKGPLVGAQQLMPMNLEGFERFEKMVTRLYEHLRDTCINKLGSHFDLFPDEIPPLDRVGDTLSEQMELISGPRME